MKELLEKISTYHILNYLLPGTIFGIISEKFVGYSLTNKDILIEIFTFYFAGLVISRFSSIVIEPLFKRLSIIKFAPYSQFLSASKKDSKLELLSEENNMYRSFTATFLLLLLFKVWVAIENKVEILKHSELYILISLLLIVFIISYRKQTRYITSRIKFLEESK
jgi:hypothetical protein